MQTTDVDQAHSPTGQTKIRANSPEGRERIKALIETLQPEVQPNGVHILIPYQDESIHFPTRVKKGMPDLAKEHVLKLYRTEYGCAMSTLAYRQVLKEMVGKSSDVHVQPEDLTLVSGTIDIFISLTSNKGYQRRGKIDNPYYVPIIEELPQISRVLHTPDAAKGHVTQYEVTIAGKTAVLSSDEMRSGKWIEKYPRLKGVGNAYSTGAYMQVMQHLAHEAPMIHTVTHSGVHAIETEDRAVYGYMTDAGTFLTGKTEYQGSVDYAHKVTGDHFARWERYERIAQGWNKQQAIASIDYCTQLTPTDGQALVLLCHQARTLTRFIRNSNFRTGYGVYLYGPGGNGKTSLAIMTSSVGKPYMYPEGVDATFRNTVTAIETKLDAVGDRPFIIDDLHRAPDETQHQVQQRERAVDSIIRSATDGSPIRERMTSNITFQKINTVKTFPTVTGEYFPISMATSFMRRTLFIEIPKNSIPRKAKQQAVSLENASTHVDGLYKLGRRMILALLDVVNTRGLESVADQLHKKHTEYYSNLYDLVVELWTGNGYQDIPPYVDSILDASANILLGGYLIDHVTGKACNVVETVRGYLVNIVYSQLLVMAGMKQINGVTILDQTLYELFTAIAEEKRVNNVLLVAEDYSKQSTKIDVVITLTNGKEHRIPYEQWHGRHDRVEKQVAAYIHIGRKIVYLTSIGRDALLHIAANTEGLEQRIRTATALSQQLDREKWLVARNGKNLDVPCRPQSKALLRCLPLSLERLIALIYDQECIEDELDTPVDQAQTATAEIPTSLAEEMESILANL